MGVRSGVSTLRPPRCAERCEGSAGYPTEEGRRLREEFEQRVGQLRPDLYRYAFWLCRDPALAEDVVQETLIRAWRSLGSLKDRSAIKPWLLTIVRREHARVYERKRLESADIDGLGGAEQLLIATTEDTEVAEMRQAIASLEADYREPLVLQVLMGYTADEIGQIMGLKTGAVLTRLFRARMKLAAKFLSDK